MSEKQIEHTKISKNSSAGSSEASSTQSKASHKRQDFEIIQNILQHDVVDLDCLKKMNWQGLNCPSTRAQIWRLILGHESHDRNIRSEELQTRRLDYIEKLKRLQNSSRRTKSIKTLLGPLLEYELFRMDDIQDSLTKLILLISESESLKKKYILSFIIPFYVVFLSEFYPLDLKTLDVQEEGLQKTYLNIVEADTYCCSITFIGTFRNIRNSNLTKKTIKALERFDPILYNHVTAETKQMIFLNRWLKHLFLKDFPIHICVRIFDELITNVNYSNQIEGKESHIKFIVCVSCGIFSIFRNKILMCRGQQLEDTLSKLPIENWGEIEILILISQAYLYQSILE